MIAVTFALPAESSAFLRLLQNPTRGEAGSHTISGTLHDSAIRVLHTGVGKKTTHARLPDFLREQTPQLLISSGFAGALSDQWHVGDLLFADNFSTSPLALAKHIGYRTGKLLTSPSMVDSLTQRRAFAQEGADAVDMETAFIADACAAASVPMLSLRAISDTPAAPFPAPAHVLFDVERQRTAFAPLLAYLLRHPAAIGRFISFSRQIDFARKALTRALETLIRSAQDQG